jgi:hypothetical protein
VPLGEGGEAEVFGEGALADAGLAAEEDVLSSREEAERHVELVVELAIDLARVGPVEAVVPLDRLKNMTRHRRRIAGDPAPFAEPSGLDPLALIEDEHYRRTRPAGAGSDDEDDEEV